MSDEPVKFILGDTAISAIKNILMESEDFSVVNDGRARR